MKTGNRLYFNFAILFSMAFIQLLSFFVAPADVQVFYSVIRPLGYFILLTVVLLFTNLEFGKTNRNKQMSLTILLMGSVVYIALLFLAALITNLGRNPMTFSLSVVWQYLPFVIIGEIIRFQLVNNTPKKNNRIMLWAVTLVFAFTMINTNNAAFSGEYVIGHLLPIIAVNFFLTYVCNGGALMGVLAFRSAYSLIPVFLPVLPNITTLVLAIITYFAVVVMLSLYNSYAREATPKIVLSRKSRGWLYAAPVIAVIVVAGFGLFPTAIVAVASDSMKGEFNRGDMVVMKNLTTQQATEDLKIGDIIQFKEGSIYVIHRIIEVQNDHNGERQYITKGDNNQRADDNPVSPDDIVGVARYTIPYLGFPSVLFMEFMNR